MSYVQYLTIITEIWRRGQRLAARVELCLVVAVFVALTTVLCKISLSEAYHRMGDSLLFEQLIDNIWRGRGERSSVFDSVVSVINSGAFSQGKEVWLRVANAFDPNIDRSVLTFHSYLIMYALAVFRSIARPVTILTIADVASFTGMALIVYAWLRRNDVGVAASAVFVFIMMLHPAWGVSITGQFYPDRLFMFMGLLFFVGVAERWRWPWLVLIAMLTLAITERSFTVLGLFLIGYGVLFFDRRQRSRSLVCVAAGAVLVVAGSMLQHHILDNVYYSGFMPGSLGDLQSRFASPAFRQKLSIFLAINTGFLFVSAFRWRAMLIAVAVMLPNVCGSIGGAEKTGFPTHYHSYYFPCLVWGAALGYMTIAHRASSAAAARRWPAAFASSILVAACVPIALTHLVDWTGSGRPRVSGKVALMTNALLKLPNDWREAFGPEGLPLREARDAALAAVPPGSRVVAPESTMWTIAPSNRISIYPLGLDDATHIVVVCEALPAGGWTWNALPSFLPAPQRQPIEDAFKDKAKALGFDVDHPQCGLAPFSVGVIARMPPSG